MTTRAAYRVCNAVTLHKRMVMYGLVEPKRAWADEAGEAVYSLREHVERLRKALERDPLRRGPRSAIAIPTPDLRLPEAIEEVRRLRSYVVGSPRGLERAPGSRRGGGNGANRATASVGLGLGRSRRALRFLCRLVLVPAHVPARARSSLARRSNGARPMTSAKGAEVRVPSRHVARRCARRCGAPRKGSALAGHRCG
jgi:hypothetical protein